MGTETQSGMLLYGTNASGKSSLMKAVGLNIIMAQAGFYTASQEFTFSPYKHLFTRILNNDNIFKGDVVSLNVQNTIAIASKKNISLLGVENLIVIETADSILVTNKNNAQSIKELVKLLKENHQHLLSEHTRVNRPWGWFEIIEEGIQFKVKRILVNPGAKLL